jgi:hypothetical protein
LKKTRQAVSAASQSEPNIPRAMAKASSPIETLTTAMSRITPSNPNPSS